MLDLPATWGIVGATLVARNVARTGCGASACDYALTAWWKESGRWVVVRGRDSETDDFFGGGPPFRATWDTIAAACSG